MRFSRVHELLHFKVFNHRREPPYVISVGVGGNEEVDLPDPPSLQILHHLLPGVSFSPVDENILTVWALDQGTVSLPHIDETDLDLLPV